MAKLSPEVRRALADSVLGMAPDPEDSIRFGQDMDSDPGAALQRARDTRYALSDHRGLLELQQGDVPDPTAVAGEIEVLDRRQAMLDNAIGLAEHELFPDE